MINLGLASKSEQRSTQTFHTFIRTSNTYWALSCLAIIAAAILDSRSQHCERTNVFSSFSFSKTLYTAFKITRLIAASALVLSSSLRRISFTSIPSHWNLNPNNPIRNLKTCLEKEEKVALLLLDILVKNVTTSPYSLQIKRTTTINTQYQFMLAISFQDRGLRPPRADDRRSITGEIPSDRRCLRKLSFIFPIQCCKKREVLSV